MDLPCRSSRVTNSALLGDPFRDAPRNYESTAVDLKWGCVPESLKSATPHPFRRDGRLPSDQLLPNRRLHPVWETPRSACRPAPDPGSILGSPQEAVLLNKTNRLGRKNFCCDKNLS